MTNPEVGRIRGNYVDAQLVELHFGRHFNVSRLKVALDSDARHLGLEVAEIA